MRGVGFLRQFVQEVEKGLALADEQAIVLEKGDRCYGTSLLSRDGPNHRAKGQVRVNELAGRSEYLVGVVPGGIIGAIGGIGQIWGFGQLREDDVAIVI